MYPPSIARMRIDGIVRRIATVIHGMRQMFRWLIMRGELRASIGPLPSNVHPRLRIRRRLRLMNRVLDFG